MPFNLARAEGELEPVHSSKYCRRRPSKTRHALRGKITAADPLENNGAEGDVMSPKSKSRHHLRKEIERLVEENRKLTEKLEQLQVNSGTADELKEKDSLITKIRTKYQKLEYSHENTVQECERLSAMLEQRDMEYRQLHIHHEELTRVLEELKKMKQDLLTTNHKFEAENTQLQEDTMLLKNLVYRLNAELERYQEKLKDCKAASSQKIIGSVINTSDEHGKMVESWGNVDRHTLGPLLDAYQENLLEKDELIAKYRSELENFSYRCKDVIAENENMYKQMENLQSQCNRFAEESKTTMEDATLIREENELLTKQTIRLKQQLKEIDSLYAQKVESLSESNNKLNRDYLACKTELSNLLGKYEIIEKEYRKMTSESEKTVPLSVHTAAVQECKHLFEELKSQYEAEKKKLCDQVKRLEELQPDNAEQLAVTIVEKNHLQALTKTLEKNLKKTQHKLECIQNTVTSMKISRDALKKQLNKVTTYCKDLVSEYEELMAEKERLVNLLHEKEKDNVHILYLGDSIAHRVNYVKNQLKDIQKDAEEQLATVEKHIKTQESGVNKMKNEYHQELQRLKHLLRQKEITIGQLQREKFLTRDNLELMWKTASSDEKKVENALKNTRIYV